jgi:response regulator RpfG family c-di-GMP phosphodiesterase
MEDIAVLLVDDDEAILRSLADLLRRRCRVFTADSAYQAGILLKKHDIHVVVTDHKMPGQSGLSFLLDVKKSHPRTLRVLMTAFADMNLVIRALNEGEIHRFLSKPFKPLEFSTIMDDCIRLARISRDGADHVAEAGSIIIAHDSAISLATLRIVIGPSYRLLSTSNGLEVLSLVSSNSVDALVLGIGLEMLDGCTITAYLKREKEVSFPIVFWSTALTTAMEAHLQDCGADFWIDENSPRASASLREFLERKLRHP